MCGRYVVAQEAEGIQLAFDLRTEGSSPEQMEELNQAEDLEQFREHYRPSYNVAPTSTVPLILIKPGESAPSLVTARWGLIPSWAKEASMGAKTFNARSETVMSKPSFRSAIRSRRAVIPVEGYYEWLAPERAGGRKRPFYVHPGGDSPSSMIGFAGIYEWWKDPAGPQDAPWVLSCSMLTMESPGPDEPGTLGELGRLHNRLPVPLDPQMMRAWMEPPSEGASKDELADDAARLLEEALAGAYDLASTWELREVGPEVGNVRNNGPQLIEPVGSLF